MTLELNKHTHAYSYIVRSVLVFIYSEVRTSTPFQFGSQRWRTEEKRTTVSEYVACNSHTKASHPSSPTSTSTSNPDLDASSLAPTDLVINQSILSLLLIHSLTHLNINWLETSPGDFSFESLPTLSKK